MAHNEGGAPQCVQAGQDAPKCGLNISPSTELRKILRLYPSGLQCFSEALQNADDTGRAGTFRAMLDLRRHPAAKLRPPAARATLQGEAILFCDDAGFTERDWRSLENMCDSEKKKKPSETGQFGMGSRSYFHITDVLQVLSGSTLALLDPDDILQTGLYGERIKFLEGNWSATYADEVAPFEGVFGCDMRSEYKGTIIRAAFRGQERAEECSFMPQSFDVSSAEKMFRDFEESLKNGEVLLFLTCVECVELWRWDSGADQSTMVARTRIGVSSGHALPRAMSSPREARRFLQQLETFEDLESALLTSATEVPEVWDVVETATDSAVTGARAVQRWLRIGSFSRDREIVKLATACDCVPIVTIALPLGQPVLGRVFTVLPLPLFTNLPVHLNSAFRLQVNRRGMWRLTADLEGEHRLWAEWNEQALVSIAPRVYAQALELLANAANFVPDHGYSLWPRPQEVDKEFELILGPLVEAIRPLQVLPAPNGGMFSPADAVYFRTPTRALRACRGHLLELCARAGWKVVDPPDHIVDLLDNFNALEILDSRCVFVDVFLPAAPSLETGLRASVVLAFLEWAGSWKQEEIVELGEAHAALRWLPTEGGSVCATRDCFDPVQSPEALGVVRDRRAQIGQLLASADLDASLVWRVLRLHGLGQEITWKDAVEEAEAVAEQRDVPRAQRLFAHLDSRHANLKGDREGDGALKRLQQLSWIPATKPGLGSGACEAVQLLRVDDIFPAPARGLVWAVAPCLVFDTEPDIPELRARRLVETEPEVLAKQVRILMGPTAAIGSEASGMSTADIGHLRKVFGALAPTRTLLDVVIPASSELVEVKRTTLFLTFLDWASTLSEVEIKTVREHLSDIRWMPTASGVTCCIVDSFDPVQSPDAFGVVRRSKANIDPLIAGSGLQADNLWRVLRLCGIKTQITWEDAVEEAETIVQDGDTMRAAQLLMYIDEHHADLRGSRSNALARLRELAWVPARRPMADFGGDAEVQLLPLRDMFGCSVHKLVWAVAPSLSLGRDPALHELKAIRTIEDEPEILVKQAHSLLEYAARTTGASALEHFRALFSRVPPSRVLPELILPACANIAGDRLASLLLPFLDWADSWPEAELAKLGTKVNSIAWIPVAAGGLCPIRECFDPANSPAMFATVNCNRANLDSALAIAGVRCEAVWRVLRICGLKQQLTWEDAVNEAKAISNDGDVARAKQLFVYVERHHADLLGSRAAALRQLRSLAWAPAKTASRDIDVRNELQLLPLKDLFPASAFDLVWAVAPSLCVEGEGALHELKPGRSLESEPTILVEQIFALLDDNVEARGAPRQGGGVLEHACAVFAALPPIRSVLEVLLPAASSLTGPKLTTLLVGFLEWAGCLEDADIRELGKHVSDIRWLPSGSGELRNISHCFDPEHSPTGFAVVQKRVAALAPAISQAGADSATVWRSLQLCGLKRQISWEYAVEEAEDIIRDASASRAEGLYRYLNEQHAALEGNRTASLERLQHLEWVPAMEATANPQSWETKRLRALVDVFPASAFSLIWAAAPTLCLETEPAVPELGACRRVENSPTVVLDQLVMLADATIQGSHKLSCTMLEALHHLRAVFGALPLDRMLSEVMVPAARRLSTPQLANVMLGFLDWASASKPDDLLLVARRLEDVRWIPASDSTVAIKDSFDPDQSPTEFQIVRTRLVHLDASLSQLELRAADVWKVLRTCGMKAQLTWEDAVQEAELLAEDQDLPRAKLLFAYLEEHHADLQGARDLCLARLRGLVWIPAAEPTEDPEACDATTLLALENVFASSDRHLVWAVAPSLCVEEEPTLHELRPGRTIENEPDMLVEQIRALALSATVVDEGPPCIEAATLEHFCEAFRALAPLLSQVERLSEHPRLSEIAFVPCEPPDSRWSAALFTPRRAAFNAHDHRALSPALGIVKSLNHTIRTLAEMADVAQDPSAELLAEILRQQSPGKTRSDLVVTLAIELASRLRAGDDRPSNIVVPTSCGKLESVERVYIEDAPWRNGDILTLHPRISAGNGLLLGCTSVRVELQNQCEVEGHSAEGDPFGQEADLVGQIKQLLQEYGDSADLIKEFVQNTDDAGATSMTFIIEDDQGFGTERVVDTRAKKLQGPAVYVCSDKPLSPEDIANMQRVGHSKKRMDFFSSGRFGVGLNVMYRYCDCPQLLANNALHYFDLTRSYVAAPGMRRGRKFSAAEFRKTFPDSYSPFESKIIAEFPTVFRLALRAESSELGDRVDIADVRAELKGAAASADKMLLFTRKLKRLEFYDGPSFIAKYHAEIKDQSGYDEYFASLPATPLDLKPGHLRKHLSQKTIQHELPDASLTAEWAITYRVGITSDAMHSTLKSQLEKPHGVALLPLGAAAVRVKPFEDQPRSGRICSGLPTTFKSNSSAWINGGFALLSSRKSLPLPEESDESPTLDMAWNRMLIEGPVAESMHGLIVHCTSLVLFHGLKVDQYFSLFPLRGDRLQKYLALATFKASLNSPIFPVLHDKETAWVSGPTPSFFNVELGDEIQKALASDGMKLVTLPRELFVEYEQAIGKPRERVGGMETLRFLVERFKELHGDPTKEFKLEDTEMASLAKKEFIIELLASISKCLWKQHYHATVNKGSWHLHKFDLDGLRGAPLFLTHANTVTVFGDNVKFSTMRDILPRRQDLFVDRECHIAMLEAVDETMDGIKNIVELTIPFVRPFALNDLLPYRDDFEKSVHRNVAFAHPDNGTLRMFWSLVAESSMTPAANATCSKWYNVVGDWQLLPIYSSDGEGENGEGCATLEASRSCVAVPAIEKDASIAESLQSMLLACNINVVQAELLVDERVANIIHPFVITSCKQMLDILTTAGDFSFLTPAMRHEMLAYFSVLSVQGGVDLLSVAQLPLFMTATTNSTFIRLDLEAARCCIDPADKHSKTLCNLTPPGVEVLAWPTQQLKPLYERLGIQLRTGSDFLVNHVVPVLPQLCMDADGKNIAQPFLAELHAFVCIDQDERVKQAAAECGFVPSSDCSRCGPPRMYVTTATGAAAAFQDVLGAAHHLPARWMQSNRHHVELLHALGMSANLSPEMILLCARHLDAAYAAELGSKTDESTAADPRLDRKDEAEVESKADLKTETEAIDEGKEIPGSASSRPAKGVRKGTRTPAAQGDAGAIVPYGSGANSGKGKRTGPAATTRPAASSAAGLSDAMVLMSFELVEEFSLAAKAFWPNSRTGEAPKMQDMSTLLEAASLRILLARRLDTDQLRRHEVQCRNATVSSPNRPDWHLDQTTLQRSELVLVPFEKASFESATQMLWSCCPLVDHQSHAPAVKEGCTHLQGMIERHRGEIKTVFGSFVAVEDTPPDLVMKHLLCLCSSLESESGPASVKLGSVLHNDLKACWSHLAEFVDFLRDGEMETTFRQMQDVPCVAVSSEDVANRPADQIYLALPAFSFFHMPPLSGKEANLRLYLRQIIADSAKEASLFRAIGARERPRAPDFAAASERVAALAEKMGHTGFEWLVAVLEACVQGFHEDVTYMQSQGHEVPQVTNLHLFTTDGCICPAIHLVWVDVPRWASRCRQEESLRFCLLNGNEQREIANSLVAAAGLRKLSAVIDERVFVQDVAADDAGDQTKMDLKALKETVECLVKSYEFASGVRAVILHSQERQPAISVPLAKLREDLSAIRFQVTSKHLRSALVWKKNGQAIAGSEHDQNVFYDASEGFVFLGGACSLDNPEFVAGLVSSLRTALPLLAKIEASLLEGVLRRGLRDGPGSVEKFLKDRDIRVGGFAKRNLGPGDQLPADLHDHVNWSMTATFGEGEVAAILMEDVFTIAEVARWPTGTTRPGEGIGRSYRLRMAADRFETRKHFEVYKIHGSAEQKKARRNDEIAVVPDAEADDVEGEATSQDEKHIIDVKRYLHEMANMPPDEYKTVMRRLFKTWHPDKAGDTALSRKIFLMLRRHEQWYKKWQAGETAQDDSWLDNADDAEQTPADGERLALPPIVETREPAVQSSWFDEFMWEAEEARGATPPAPPTSKAKAPSVPRLVQPPDWETPVDGPTRVPGDPTRVIDRQQAPRWLHQAKLDLLAACSLVKPTQGLRALPAAAVWHCEQSVEMAIKAVMFRTCGVSEDESVGKLAHDIHIFIHRLRRARANTAEQAKWQDIPLTDADCQWLRNSYLNARYPKPGRSSVPGERYTSADAERAIRLADSFLKWAQTVEDLPDPGIAEQQVVDPEKEGERMMALRKRRWTQLQKDADNKDVMQTDAHRTMPMNFASSTPKQIAAPTSKFAMTKGKAPAPGSAAPCGIGAKFAPAMPPAINPPPKTTAPSPAAAPAFAPPMTKMPITGAPATVEPMSKHPRVDELGGTAVERRERSRSRDRPPAMPSVKDRVAELKLRLEQRNRVGR